MSYIDNFLKEKTMLSISMVVQHSIVGMAGCGRSFDIDCGISSRMG